MSFDQDPNEQANISRADLLILIDELKQTLDQRDELLAALKRIDSMCERPIRYGSIDVQEVARASIAKATGGKHE